MAIMGFVQWFPKGDKRLVEATVRDLHATGVTHLRTGFSWADWEWDDRNNPAGMTGKEWFLWLFPYLMREGIDILPDFLYIPLAKARPDEQGIRRVSHPPEHPEEYAAFVGEAIDALGHCFSHVELLNEGHLRQEWNMDLDPDYSIYRDTLIGAAEAAHRKGKKTVLGGPTAHHFDWLEDRAKDGVVAHMDVVGFHAFQYSVWGAKHSAKPITEYAKDLKRILAPHGFSGEVWLTEVGYPTGGEPGVSELMQAEIYEAIFAQDEIARAYWWSLADLDPAAQSYTETQIGWREENFYHFGVKKFDGTPKELYKRLMERNVSFRPAA
jgi:CDP-paratose 2-epimerase